MDTSPKPEDQPVDVPEDVKPSKASTQEAASSPLPTSTHGPAGQPVDNPLVETEPDEPMQEMQEADLPPEISPGAMGIPRIKLVQALGFTADHMFDAEVEDRLLQVCPDYAGTVTKDMWRKILQEGHVFRTPVPSQP